MLALMAMGNYASLPFSNSAKGLACQTAFDGNFDPQRFSGVVSNHSKHKHIKGPVRLADAKREPAGLLASASWEASCETQQGAAYE